MRRNWLKSQVHSKIVVYTTDKNVFDGVLWSTDKDGVTLVDVQIRSDNDVTLAGHIHVPREKVAFVQVP